MADFKKFSHNLAAFIDFVIPDFDPCFSWVFKFVISDFLKEDCFVVVYFQQVSNIFFISLKQGRLR